MAADKHMGGGVICWPGKGVELEALICRFGAGQKGEFAVESAGLRFNSMMLSGKAWAAIRMVTENDPGGLFQPSNI